MIVQVVVPAFYLAGESSKAVDPHDNVDFRTVGVFMSHVNGAPSTGLSLMARKTAGSALRFGSFARSAANC